MILNKAESMSRDRDALRKPDRSEFGKSWQFDLLLTHSEKLKDIFIAFIRYIHNHQPLSIFAAHRNIIPTSHH